MEEAERWLAPEPRLHAGARRVRALIDDGRIHVFDGAMGTLLYGRGVFVNVCYDELNLSRPELVEGIHREYVAAGAEILETNTFGANPVKLSSYGLEARTEEVNEAAARLARSAADRVGDRAVHVAGAIGPLGIRIEPWGPTSLEEAAELYRRQVVGLLEGGVDGFVLETFADVSEVECALRAVRRACDLPVFAQMTVGQDGRTAFGSDPAHLAAALEAAGADVVGLNCSVGPRRHARRDRRDGGGHHPAPSPRSRTRGSRARSGTGRSTWPARSTWRSTPAG